MLEPLVPSWEIAPKRVLNNNKGGTLAFSAGKEVSIQLDNGDVLEGHDLLLTGGITTDVAPAGTVREGQPWDLVTKLRVYGPGGDIINASGQALRILSAIRQARADDVDPVTAAEHAAPATAVPFDGALRLAYVEPKANPRHYGLLCTVNAAREGAFQMAVTWGNGVADLVDGSNSTMTTAPSINVQKRVVQGLKRVAPSGYGTHLALARELAAELASTSNEYKVPLNRGRHLHGLLLVCRQGATAALSDAPLNASGTIRVKVGNTPIIETTVAAARAAQKQYFPENFPALPGVIWLPLIDTVGNSQPVNSQAQYLPDTLDCVLELPIVGAATNRIEVVEVSREDVAVAAARFGFRQPQA